MTASRAPPRSAIMASCRRAATSSRSALPPPSWIRGTTGSRSAWSRARRRWARPGWMPICPRLVALHAARRRRRRQRHDRHDDGERRSRRALFPAHARGPPAGRAGIRAVLRLQRLVRTAREGGAACARRGRGAGGLRGRCRGVGGPAGTPLAGLRGLGRRRHACQPGARRARPDRALRGFRRRLRSTTAGRCSGPWAARGWPRRRCCSQACRPPSASPACSTTRPAARRPQRRTWGRCRRPRAWSRTGNRCGRHCAAAAPPPGPEPEWPPAEFPPPEFPPLEPLPPTPPRPRAG